MPALGPYYVHICVYTKFFYIVGTYISPLPLREDVFSIVLRQNSSLYKAFNETQQVNRSLDSIVSEYRKTLRQFIVDLHLLGYPIISFYVDHHLVHNIAYQHHITLANTLQTMMVISSEFAHTCYVADQNPVKISLCGMIHAYNLPSMHSKLPMPYVHEIRIPHMFYVQLQFLEIILVGGWRLSECNSYQVIKVWHFMIFPFSSIPQKKNLAFIFCGSHPPFTAVVPANCIHLEAFFNIQNTVASCKLRYSAIDKLVSINFSIT